MNVSYSDGSSKGYEYPRPHPSQDSPYSFMSNSGVSTASDTVSGLTFTFGYSYSDSQDNYSIYAKVSGKPTESGTVSAESTITIYLLNSSDSTYIERTYNVYASVDVDGKPTETITSANNGGSGTLLNPYIIRLNTWTEYTITIPSAGSFGSFAGVNKAVSISGLSITLNGSSYASVPTSGISAGQMPAALYMSGTPTSCGSWLLKSSNPAGSTYWRIDVTNCDDSLIAYGAGTSSNPYVYEFAAYDLEQSFTVPGGLHDGWRATSSTIDESGIWFVFDGTKYTSLTTSGVKNASASDTSLTVYVDCVEPGQWDFRSIDSLSASSYTYYRIIAHGYNSVESITINGGSGVETGYSSYFYATISPADAEYKKVVWGLWSDGSGGSATITSSGDTWCYIQGVSAGTVTLSATAYDECGATASKTITVTYTQYTHTAKLEFNANGGSGAPATQSDSYIDYASYGSGYKTFTIPPTEPTWSGHVFLGWSTDSSATAASYQATGSDTIDVYYGDTTKLYAVWGTALTITYSVDGSTTKIAADTATLPRASTSYTTTVTETKPTISDAGFKGWSLSQGSTEIAYASGASITISTDTTLYAVFSSNQVLDYDLNGGSGSISPTSSTVLWTLSSNIYLTPTTETPTPPSGKVFVGWSDNTGSTANSFKAYPGTVTMLYAVYADDPYPYSFTVSYEDYDGSPLSSSDAERFPDGTMKGDNYTLRYIIPVGSPTAQYGTFSHWAMANYQNSAQWYQYQASFFITAGTAFSFSDTDSELSMPAMSISSIFDSETGEAVDWLTISCDYVNGSVVYTVSGTAPSTAGDYTIWASFTSPHGSGTLKLQFTVRDLAFGGEYESGREIYLYRGNTIFRAVFTCEVTYCTVPGEVWRTQTVAVGTETDLPEETPTRDGYLFDGYWTTDEDDAGQGDEYWLADGSDPADKLVVYEDTTLYASWRALITVTYDANGGCGAPDSVTAGYGTTFLVGGVTVEDTSALLTTESFIPLSYGAEYHDTLVGYAPLRLGAHQVEDFPSLDTLTDDMTVNGLQLHFDFTGKGFTRVNGSLMFVYILVGVYASGCTEDIWTETIRVTGTDSSDGTSRSVDAKLYVVPGRDGYRFAGWAESADATEAGYQYGDSLKLSSDKTLYAVWEQAEYDHTVRFDSNGGSGRMSDLVVTDDVEGESEVVLPDCTYTRTGFHFAGWRIGSATYLVGAAVPVAGGSSVTAIAQWEENTILLDAIGTQYAVAGKTVNFSVSWISSPPGASATVSASEAADGLTVAVKNNVVTCSASEAGTYTFTLTVGASGYSSDSQTVTVVIAAELAFTNTPTAGAITS